MKKFMTIAAMFAAVMMTFSACNKEDKPEGGQTTDPNACEECGKNPCECEPEYESPITIDGDFSDWDAVQAVEATCAANAKWTALTKVKVYADEVYINVYFEFSEDEIVDLAWVPFHVYLNQDASAATGNDQFIGQGGVDFLFEGPVFADGAFCSYDPGMFQYTGSEDEVEWAYESLLPENSGIGSGAGSGNKYEFALLKEMMMGADIQDTFTIGFDIQQSWNSVGVLPNTDVADDNANGAVEMLTITTAK